MFCTDLYFPATHLFDEIVNRVSSARNKSSNELSFRRFIRLCHVIAFTAHESLTRIHLNISQLQSAINCFHHSALRYTFPISLLFILKRANIAHRSGLSYFESLSPYDKLHLLLIAMSNCAESSSIFHFSKRENDEQTVANIFFSHNGEKRRQKSDRISVTYTHPPIYTSRKYFIEPRATRRAISPRKI